MVHRERIPGAPVGPDNTEPTPTYNPRTLIDMATSVETYLAALPPVVGELWSTSQEDIEAMFGDDSDWQAQLIMQRMQQTAETLVDQGQYWLRFSLLNRFFDEDPSIKHLNMGLERRLRVDQKLTLLPPGYRQKWDEHLATGELPRESAPEVIQAVATIQGVPYEMPVVLEDIHHSRTADVYSRMDRVGYQIALHVLPDITDAEAERIFYPGITAEQVRGIAAGILPVE